MAARTPKTPAIPDYFRATGTDLKAAVAAGDKAAEAEVARRAAKKAASKA